MGHDPFSPVTSAAINVLCVPAGQIKVEKFIKALQWLKQHVSVVQDPTLVGRPQTAPVLLNISDATGDSFLERSEFYEPNRNVQIIFGLIDGDLPRSPKNGQEDWSTLASSLKEFAHATFGELVQTELLIIFESGFKDRDEKYGCVSLEDDHAPSPLVARVRQSVKLTGERALLHLQNAEIELPKSKADSLRRSSIDAPQETKADDVRRQSIMSTFTRTPPTTSSVQEEDHQPSVAGKTISAASLKLQMGLWSEALEQFADGARSARESSDPAWHGKALEGVLLALLLHAWAGLEFQIPQNCYPTNRGYSSSVAVHNISEANRALSEQFASSNTHRLQALTATLPGFLATILNLYDRAAMGWDNSLPRIIVCEARVRLATLLLHTKATHGFITLETLDNLFGLGSVIRGDSALDSPSAPLSLRSTSIASLLIEAFHEAQVHLHVNAAMSILVAVCQQLSQLGLERKQGFFLRDVLQRLPPLLEEGRRWAPRGSHPIPFILIDRQYLKTRQGIRTLLQTALKAFDIPDQQNLDIKPDHQDTNQINVRLSAWLSILTRGDIAPKLEILRLCIRVSDALPDYEASAYFMSLLLFVVRQTVTLQTTSVNNVPLIAAEEQLRLTTGLHGTVLVAYEHPKHASILAQYWDDFLVRDLNLCEPENTGKLMAHSSADLTMTTTSGTSRKDPFIYNPFSSDTKSSGPAVLVKDEVATFDIVLQNPLEVEVEIERMSLVAEGCVFETPPHSAIIRPLSVQVFSIRGTPQSSGPLTISKCNIKVKDCEERDFSVFVGTWRPPVATKRKVSQDIVTSLPEMKSLALKVVEPLPQLHVKSSTLIQPSIMLLDGETCRFSIVLENTGDIPADLVLFTFQDSVSKQYQEALTNKDLSPADNYEMQYQLTHRPAIRRIQDKSTKSTAPANVEAKDAQTFVFEILGKPGLTYATIFIDYAYLGKPRNEFDGTFYTRQLKYHIQVTVNGSVDVQRCSALSVLEHSLEKMVDRLQVSNVNGTATDSSQTDSQCILQIDLRSIWQSPINVNIETSDPSVTTSSKEWRQATSLTLLPAQYTRSLLHFQRIYLPNPHESIPAIHQSNRQFVVSATKLSLEAEMATREMFWYREEICQNLRITWKEAFGENPRHGELDIRRGIRPTPRMIDVLRIEHVSMTFDIVPVQPENSVSLVEGEFTIKRNASYKLIVKTHNRTQEDMLLLLRLHPCLHDQPHNIAMNLSKKFIWSGVLQQVIKGGIKPNESAESSLEVIGLAYGLYEVNATVEEVRPKRRAIEGVSGTNSNRRIWHARQPALIRVVP